MKFSINPPKGFLGWTIYLIIGKFVIDIAKYLYNHRGSSSETKKDMAEIRKALAKNITKEDIRKIIREENKNFITKDLFEEKMKRVKEEILHDYEIKFLEMKSFNEKSLIAYEEAKTEHRNGKRRNEDIFLKISEKLGNETKKRK